VRKKKCWKFSVGSPKLMKKTNVSVWHFYILSGQPGKNSQKFEFFTLRIKFHQQNTLKYSDVH
jgi:hypothetical protein